MGAWNDKLLTMNKLLGSRDRAKRHASNFDFALSISPCLLLQRGGIFWTPQQRLEIRSSKSKRREDRRSGVEGKGNSRATTRPPTLSTSSTAALDACAVRPHGL